MTRLATPMSNFTRFHGTLRAPTPSWLDDLRQKGVARFEQVGFPSIKDEEWRFTNVAPIAKLNFDLGDAELPAEAMEKVRLLHSQYTMGREAVAELVFVNGHFSPALSKLDRLPRGVTLRSLSDVLSTSPELLEPHLARHADMQANPFTALNTGFIRDGAYVHVARNSISKSPLHLLFISAPGMTPTISHPRVLIVAEQGSESAVVESYVGPQNGTYLSNSVVEIVAGANAQLDHCKLNQESLLAYHLSATQMTLARDANVISHSATVGGKLTRNDVNVLLNGENAHVTLNGLVIIGGDQHCDNHTLLHHEKPNCPSHELYKHVLDGRATGVFKGKIFVQKDAQKTDSKQTSKSLLLSDDVMMESMPALEIYADDVKCTHGSTTGPVDEDMVFYLRSRGVSLDAARHLLTYAFAADITRRIRVDAVRRRLEDFMAAQHGLPQDLRITDLGSHDERAR